MQKRTIFFSSGVSNELFFRGNVQWSSFVEYGRWDSRRSRRGSVGVSGGVGGVALKEAGANFTDRQIEQFEQTVKLSNLNTKIQYETIRGFL